MTAFHVWFWSTSPSASRSSPGNDQACRQTQSVVPCAASACIRHSWCGPCTVSSKQTTWPSGWDTGPCCRQGMLTELRHCPPCMAVAAHVPVEHPRHQMPAGMSSCTPQQSFSECMFRTSTLLALSQGTKVASSERGRCTGMLESMQSSFPETSACLQMQTGATSIPPDCMLPPVG